MTAENKNVVESLIAVAIGMAVMIGLALAVHFVVRADAAWINVAAEWDQYRLNDNQRAWFKSVKAKSGVPCCDIADGHPTEMEHRQDGYYIPDPRDPTDKDKWLKVPEDAMTTPRNNPVGVATVWYVIYPPGTNPEVYIRCFVAEAET